MQRILWTLEICAFLVVVGWAAVAIVRTVTQRNRRIEEMEERAKDRLATAETVQKVSEINKLVKELTKEDEKS